MASVEGAVSEVTTGTSEVTTGTLAPLEEAAVQAVEDMDTEAAVVPVVAVVAYSEEAVVLAAEVLAQSAGLVAAAAAAVVAMTDKEEVGHTAEVVSLEGVITEVALEAGSVDHQMVDMAAAEAADMEGDHLVE